MKKLNNCLIVIFLMPFWSCKEILNKETGDCVGFVLDMSDTFAEITQLSVNQIKPLWSIDKEPNESAICLIEKISDIRNNKQSIISVEGETTIEGNILHRKSLRDTFFSRIEENLQHIKSGPTGTKGSFCLYAVSKMLHGLMACQNCSKRKLLIFGDLAENSTVFSVYNKAHFKILKETPDTAFTLFDREYPLPISNGKVEIILIHQPQSRAADEQYFVLSRAFKNYYEKHGYAVTITASIATE